MNNDTKIFVELPEFFFLRNTWLALLLDMQIHKGLFNNVEVSGICGCFPNMIWDDNKVCISENNVDSKTVENVFSSYKKYNVDLIFTLTNLNITEKDLNDPYCNMIMEYANQYKAQCNVVNIELENHIRSKYPNILINKSSIKNYIDDTYKFNNRCLSTYEQTISDCIKFLVKDIYFSQMLNRYLKMAKNEINQLSKEKEKTCKFHQ